MKKLFVPYELAVLAKEKGFDDLCFALIDKKNRLHILDASDESELESDMEVAKYNNVPCVPAPLYQQIEKWFMDNHDLFFSNSRSMGFYKVRLYRISTGQEIEIDNRNFDYYKSLTSALTEAFKLI